MTAADHWTPPTAVVMGPRDSPAFPYSSVSQPPGRGPVPGPGINYTGPLDVLLEFVILVF